MSNAETQPECVICRGASGDAELLRIQVWEDALWRLTVSLDAEVLGFAYLEPRRHIPHITDLDGEEARTFGEVLARVSRVLREETGAELHSGYSSAWGRKDSIGCPTVLCRARCPAVAAT